VGGVNFLGGGMKVGLLVGIMTKNSQDILALTGYFAYT